MRPKPWRVRVKKIVEDSVEVLGLTAEEAEMNAAAVPGVMQVLMGHTIPADKLAEPEDHPIGVLGDLFGGRW